MIWEEEIRNVFQSESIALGLPLFFWVQPFLRWERLVHMHDEVSTSAVTDTPLSASVLTDTAADPATTVDQSEKQVVSVKEDGNTTVPTSVLTTGSLEDAKASAVKEGVEVEETAPQTHTSLEGAIADNQCTIKRD